MTEPTSATTTSPPSKSKPTRMLDGLLPAKIQQNRLIKFGLSIAGVIVLIALTGVYTIVQTSTVLSPADHAIVVRNMLLIIGVAVVSLAAVGVGLARPTIKEIVRLEDSAERIESGDLDTVVKTDDTMWDSDDTGETPAETSPTVGETATADGGTDRRDEEFSAPESSTTTEFNFEST